MVTWSLGAPFSVSSRLRRRRTALRNDGKARLQVARPCPERWGCSVQCARPVGSIGRQSGCGNSRSRRPSPATTLRRYRKRNVQSVGKRGRSWRQSSRQGGTRDQPLARAGARVRCAVHGRARCDIVNAALPSIQYGSACRGTCSGSRVPSSSAASCRSVAAPPTCWVGSGFHRGRVRVHGRVADQRPRRPPVLVAGRALQGLGAALVSPPRSDRHDDVRKVGAHEGARRLERDCCRRRAVGLIWAAR